MLKHAVPATEWHAASYDKQLAVTTSNSNSVWNLDRNWPLKRLIWVTLPWKKVDLEKKKLTLEKKKVDFEKKLTLKKKSWLWKKVDFEKKLTLKKSWLWKKLTLKKSWPWKKVTQKVSQHCTFYQARNLKQESNAMLWSLSFLTIDPSFTTIE